MIAETEPVSLDERRSRLMLRASVVRSRLLHTIDVLETRRKNVQELGQRAKRLATPLVGTLALGIAVGAALVIAMRARAARRRHRRLSEPLAWAIASFRRADEPSFWREALRNVLFNTVIIVTSALARRGARALIGGPPLALMRGHDRGSRPAGPEDDTQPVLASPAPSWNRD